MLIFKQCGCCFCFTVGATNLLQSIFFNTNCCQTCLYTFNELTVAHGCLQHMWDFKAPSLHTLFTYNKIRITSGNLLITIKPSAPLVIMTMSICTSIHRIWHQGLLPCLRLLLNFAFLHRVCFMSRWTLSYNIIEKNFCTSDRWWKILFHHDQQTTGNFHGLDYLLLHLEDASSRSFRACHYMTL